MSGLGFQFQGDKMKRPLIALIPILLIALAVALVSAGRSHNSIGKTNQQEGHRSRTQDKIKEYLGKPTPIQEGVMTEKQKWHSKLFKRFELTTNGKKLHDMVAEGHEIFLVKTVPDGMVKSGFDLKRYLTGLTCKSSAVFLATVTSKSSQLLDEGTFTFTDYEIKIDEILKDNSAAPIRTDASAIYTAPGGAVELNGIVINAIDYRSEPLQVGGQYLFYTTYVQETGSYKGLGVVDGDTFQIKNGVVSQASEWDLPLGRRRPDADQFLVSVRMAQSQPCGPTLMRGGGFFVSPSTATA